MIFLLTGGPLWGNVLSCRGAVAQLGERLNGIQEVRSSILLSSTKKEIRVCGNADPFFVSGAGTQTAKAGALTSPGFFRIRLEVRAVRKTALWRIRRTTGNGVCPGGHRRGRRPGRTLFHPAGPGLRPCGHSGLSGAPARHAAVPAGAAAAAVSGGALRQLHAGVCPPSLPGLPARRFPDGSGQYRRLARGTGRSVRARTLDSCGFAGLSGAFLTCQKNRAVLGYAAASCRGLSRKPI